nr:MAG TPA: hypothetical protein [Caudoviricetes sp.]
MIYYIDECSVRMMGYTNLLLQRSHDYAYLLK